MSADPPRHRHALELLRKAFRPEAAEGERVTYQLVLTGDAPGQLWVDVRDGRLDTGEGVRAAPDVTFHIESGDFLGVLEGRVNPDLLFMEDRLRVEGELSLALKLRKLFRAPT
ncbi:MAG: SCP2 sterol-binding domain-containing protein [Actinomycetota bacterium]|nr:SCP2 sterol-binding domain-containing protein [Actinomycetota bacterium]